MEKTWITKSLEIGQLTWEINQSAYFFSFYIKRMIGVSYHKEWVTEPLFYQVKVLGVCRRKWAVHIPPEGSIMHPTGPNINHPAHVAQPQRKCTAWDKSLNKHFSFSLLVYVYFEDFCMWGSEWLTPWQRMLCLWLLPRLVSAYIKCHNRQDMMTNYGTSADT